VTGAERFDSDAKDEDITGAMFVATMDKVYFYANLRQGVVLAIDRGRLMGDPFNSTTTKVGSPLPENSE